MMKSVSELDKAFGNIDGISFSGLSNGMVFVEIDTPIATAKLSLYGGQVLAWQPKTQTIPVLWISNLAKFQRDKPIRAGVPICWPWFGAHPTNENLPGHGYARIANWNLLSIVSDINDATEIHLALGDSELAPTHWMSGVSLDLRVRIGTMLEIELTTRNEGVNEIEFTEGLHTYFQVSDIVNVQVFGLDGADYIDLVNKNDRRMQYGAISFDGELGRIFLKNKATCFIEDKGHKRCITVVKVGSNSTAVWNPGVEVASNMDDLGSPCWRSMVCVESANALTDKVILATNHTHKHHVIYSVSEL